MIPRACSESRRLSAAVPLLVTTLGLALLGQASAIDLNVDSFVPNADQWLTSTFLMIKERGLFTALAYLSQIILFVLWFNKVVEAWPSKNLAAIGKTTFLSVIVAAVIQSAVTSGSMTNTVYRIPITAWTSVYKASTDGLAKNIKEGLTKDTTALAQSMQDFTTNSFMGLGTMSNIDAGSLYQSGVANPGTTLDSGSTAVKQVWDEQQKFYENQRDKLDTMSWAFQIGYLILMGFFLAFAGVIYLSGASVILALFMLLPALAFWAGGRGRGLNIVLGTMMTGIATVAILPTMLLVVSGLALQQPTVTLKDAVDKQNLKAQAAVTVYANNMIQCAADAVKASKQAPPLPGVKVVTKVITREMCIVSKNASVVFSEIGRVLMRVIMGLAVMVISMIVGISIGAAVIRLVPNYIQAVFEGGPTGSDNTSVGSIGRTAIQAGAAARAMTSGVAAPLANGAMRAIGGADSGAGKSNAALGQKMSDNRAAKAITSGGGGGPSAAAGAGGAAVSAGAGAAAATAKMGGNAASGIGGQPYGASGGPNAGAAAARGAAGGAGNVAGSSASSAAGGSSGPSAVATGSGSSRTTGGAASSSSSSTAGMAPGGTVPSAAAAGGVSSSATVPNAPTTLADTGSVQSTQNPPPQVVSAGSAGGMVSSGGAPTPVSSTTGRAPAAVAQSTGGPPSPSVSSSGASQGSASASRAASGSAAVPAGAAGGAASVGAAGPSRATSSGQAGPGVVPGATSSKAINEDGAAALPGTRADQQSAKQQHAAAVKDIQQARQARQDAKNPPTATALVQRDAMNAGKAAAAAGAAAGGQLASNASRNIKAARATAKYNEANPESKKTVPEMRQQMERNGDFDRGRDNTAVRNVTAAHNAAEDRKAAGDASYVKQPVTADQARDTLSRSGNLPHQQAGNAYRAEETRREHRQNEASRQAADPNHKPTAMSAEQAKTVNEQRGNTVQAEENAAKA